MFSTTIQKIGLLSGLGILCMTLLLPAPEAMSIPAWHTIGVALLLAIWWATEVLPIPITSLLPVILFPALGIMTLEQSTLPYAEPTIFLLLGGFIMAMGLTRWNLHRRLALIILARVGNNPSALIAGFMGTTAFISMWISNTASTLMMIPIAVSLVTTLINHEAQKHQGFMVCLMLGIAYASSIGGLGTIIGTPPNLFVVGFMKQNYGMEVSFVDWMLVGIPVVIIMTALAWWILIRWSYPFDLKDIRVAKTTIHNELIAMGKLTDPEKRITVIFLLVIMAWIARVPVQQHFNILLWMSDTAIAIAGAILMFMVPSGHAQEKRTALLNWENAREIPWGVLLLVGGGLSLAQAIKESGLGTWLGMNLSGLSHLDLILLLAGLVALVTFLTELTSNTATTATLLPILAALAAVADIEPMLLFVPAALAASCAFMLPIATAPNAVVYATGFVTVPQMANAGFRLNLTAIVVVTTLSYLLVPWAFG